MDELPALPEPGADCHVLSVDYPVCVETPRLLMTQTRESDAERVTRFMAWSMR